MYTQRKTFSHLLVVGIILIAHICVMAQSSYFRNWPAGTSPQEIGKRVAENFLARKLEVELGKRQYVIYPEVCAWYGSLTVAQLINDRDLKTRLIQKFDPLLTDRAKQISPEPHVDYRVFGVVPLEIYLQTKQQTYLDLGKGLADKQWEKTTPDGITSEARYWIDDMYMVTGVKDGWLPSKTYGPAARKAWLGLVKHIDGEANVQDVCVGTNKANLEVGSNLDTQLKYYLARQRHSGDLHGQAPVLWSATALLR